MTGNFSNKNAIKFKSNLFFELDFYEKFARKLIVLVYMDSSKFALSPKSIVDIGDLTLT